MNRSRTYSPTSSHRTMFPAPPAQAYVPVSRTQRYGNSNTDYCPLPPIRWTFTFSAKEKDSETGFSYFGSRYYSSDLSFWLSVDPQASKYPSLSPYVYCADNPVRCVDPNGEDWIVCIESNQYEWHDNIKKDSPIPKGYRYVGANDDDILTDLNIVSNNQRKIECRYGVGIAGDEKDKTAAPLLGQTKIQGDLEVTARVDFDPTKKSANNRMGKTFKGVEFNATVISQVLSSNDDAAMNYNGALCLTVNGNKIYESLSAPKGSYCIGTNQTIKAASIFFPASNINKNTSFQEATISLGAPNPNMINRPVKMNFNLMLHPILRAF